MWKCFLVNCQFALSKGSAHTQTTHARGVVVAKSCGESFGAFVSAAVLTRGAHHDDHSLHPLSRRHEMLSPTGEPSVLRQTEVIPVTAIAPTASGVMLPLDNRGVTWHDIDRSHLLWPFPSTSITSITPTHTSIIYTHRFRTIEFQEAVLITHSTTYSDTIHRHMPHEASRRTLLAPRSSAQWSATAEGGDQKVGAEASCK